VGWLSVPRSLGSALQHRLTAPPGYQREQRRRGGTFSRNAITTASAVIKPQHEAR